jgi:hypothetical protein
MAEKVQVGVPALIKRVHGWEQGESSGRTSTNKLMRDLLAELSLQRVWQSIETAPADEPVLTYRGAGLMAVAENILHPADFPKEKRRIWICTDGCELLNVTHWMPLPEPPK